MKLLSRNQTLLDRVVWQSVSLLLAYPDEHHTERLDTADELVSHVSGAPRDLLRAALTALRGCDQMTAAADYVATFDLRRRCTMYLTYWTAGDTRNRGNHMLAFVQAYREAGVQPPTQEAPDYLPAVLEFAARVDAGAGRRLLVEHRVPIDVLRDTLREAHSPYAHAIEAVCATLPPPSDQEVRRAQRLAEQGPLAEAVGLQPFTLTVPPRRQAEVGAEGGR